MLHAPAAIRRPGDGSAKMVSSAPRSARDRLRPAEPLGDQDWAATPLGASESWPAALRVAFDICFHSALPASIFWGPERLTIHNEAWLALSGGESGLGRPAADLLGTFW